MERLAGSPAGVPLAPPGAARRSRVASEVAQPATRALASRQARRRDRHPGRSSRLRGLAATTRFLRGFPCGIRGSGRSFAPRAGDKLAHLQGLYGSDGTRTRDLQRDRPVLVAPGSPGLGDFRRARDFSRLASCGDWRVSAGVFSDLPRMYAGWVHCLNRQLSGCMRDEFVCLVFQPIPGPLDDGSVAAGGSEPFVDPFRGRTRRIRRRARDQHGPRTPARRSLKPPLVAASSRETAKPGRAGLSPW
jgi:hypothetical protein